MNEIKNHIDNILNIFNKKIFFHREGRTSSITCDIYIDKIFINGTKNCNINLINNCINNSLISELLFLESIREYSHTLNDSKKQEIADFFNAEKISDLETLKNDVVTSCRISSNVSLFIDMQEIIIGKCNYQKPIDFNIINTGSSNVTCIMNKIFQKLQPDFTNIKPFVIDQTFTFIFLIAILMSVLFIFYSLFFKQTRIKAEEIILF